MKKPLKKPKASFGKEAFFLMFSVVFHFFPANRLKKMRKNENFDYLWQFGCLNSLFFLAFSRFLTTPKQKTTSLSFHSL